jgi:DNA-binding HxlR family transcriptional regulator
MKRDLLDDSPCPIARSLGALGDPWAMLILRDAYYGMTRFDEFERSLKIAPNILTARLKALVQDGLLERHPYSERPPRFEYRLTEAGRDARSITLALLAWGNRHLAPEGQSVVVVNDETGELAEPVMVDRVTGRPLSDAVFRIGAGPAATEAVHGRVDAAIRRRAART